jgi:GNAT superfamily N-acetyltransferase
MIRIIPVDTRAQRRAFIDFPHELYKNDPNYVPELYMAQSDLLNEKKHPFYKHSQVALFLAYEGHTIVGRIAAILNNNHNSFNHTEDGFFGFFDTINNTLVAGLLLERAEEWLHNRGVKQVIGPVNLSTNETCGVLIDGYDTPPVAMMTYNKPYYNDLLLQLGYGKNTDLLAYQITPDGLRDKPLQVMNAFTERLRSRGITIRKANLKEFDKEVEGLKEVYNQAWDKNLGFVPMTDDEFRFMAKDIKMVLDTDFCLVAEHNGRAVGFALCIPDINEVLIQLRKGRLFPFGFIKLLRGLKKIKTLRIIALGVIEEYRMMGIESCFYGTIMQKGLEKGMRMAEASWILEGNQMMNRALEKINGKVYKKYRIYQKAI